MSLDTVIFLSNVRLSFPHITEPQKAKNTETGAERISYNADFIMPESHPGFAQFMQRYYALAQEKWKEHANTVIQMIQADRKSRCFGSGAEKVNKKTFQPYDGYVGNVFITAGRDTPPQIIQADGSPIDPANTMAYHQVTRKMYGGCRVNVALKPWLQQNKHGNGVRCDLVAIQFAGDDTPFGEGAIDASSMFGAAAAPASPAPVVPGAGMPALPFSVPSQSPANFGGVAPVVPGMPPFLSK